MLKFNTEYFNHPYYLYLKDRGDKFTVYYSVSETLSEARKQDEMIDFKKEDLPKVTGKLAKIFKTKKHKKTSEITKELNDLKKSKKKEVDEFIEDDGTFATSKVPIINRRLSPRRTMDQTVVAATMTNNPVTRGYRVYYGENEDKKGNILNELSPSDSNLLSKVPNKKSIINKINDSDLSEISKEKLKTIITKINSVDLPFELISGIKKGHIKFEGKIHKLSDDMVSFIKKLIGKERISEINYSDAYGYEETKDMNGEDTFEYLKDELGMDPIEAAERTKEFGKDYTGKKTKKASKKLQNDPNFIDRMTLSEMGRQKMIKMVEDILSKKKSTNYLVKKDNKVSKILMKNLESIKRIAEKEGIDINQLIKILKSSE